MSLIFKVFEIFNTCIHISRHIRVQSWENLLFAYVKTKAQINTQLISYIDSTTLYFINFQPLAIFCGCIARFVSNLIRNPEDRFSRGEVQIDIHPNIPVHIPSNNDSTRNLLLGPTSSDTKQSMLTWSVFL